MKTLKKLVSLIVIACLLGGVAVCFSGCGLTTRTAGTVDGEDIPAGMYIYFLHSAIYSLEQQYQYGQLSSEYSDESSEESTVESSVESSEETTDESSEEAAGANRAGVCVPPAVGGISGENAHWETLPFAAGASSANGA